MKLLRKSFEVQSEGGHPTFHNVTGSKIVIDGGMTAQLVSRQGFESGALEGGTRRQLREEALIQKGCESHG
jgi:hypothetical protein